MITLSPISDRNNSPNALKDTLGKSIQKLEHLKKEKEYYTKKKQNIIIINQQDLEIKKRQLEMKIYLTSQAIEKIKKITKNNADVTIENSKGISFEFLTYKRKVFELERKHENNQKIIKELENKLTELKDERKIDDNSYKLESDLEKSYHKLCKKEKYLIGCIKTNEVKYKQKIKECDTFSQQLSSERICLQMKILKTAQQERLLELALKQNEDEIPIEHNYHDAHFIYKPSIKSLYN